MIPTSLKGSDEPDKNIVLWSGESLDLLDSQAKGFDPERNFTQKYLKGTRVAQ